MSQVADFYNSFSERQVRAGINHRHLSIVCHLEKLGLRKKHKVLEIGCGVGPVSELILRSLSLKGSLLGVDISSKSIAIAGELTRKYPNARFQVNNITESIIDEKFDVIVMPDVIEHIPIDRHLSLFSNASKMLYDDGFIFLHIPHPNYLEWLHEIKSSELQILDQPIYTDFLLATVYKCGFYLHYLKSYSVYLEEEDYQIIVLRKKSSARNYTRLGKVRKMPLVERARRKIYFIFRGYK